MFEELTVPSKDNLPTIRREALAALIDEAVANVKSTMDVSVLHECRALFRKKVPFALRAYVAAALLLRATEKSPQGGKQRFNEPRPAEARFTDAPEKGKRQKNNGREEQRPQSNHEKQAPKPKPVQNAARQKPEENDAEQKARIRENRYQGEGITLFISAGRRQRFYARIALKMITDIENIPESAIGDIRTMDNYSFIIVDPAIEEAVINALNGTSFKGRALAVNRARKRDEADGAPLENERFSVKFSDSDLDKDGFLDSDTDSDGNFTSNQDSDFDSESDSDPDSEN